MRFSANLGFLWTELSLPDAIRAAGNAGFSAVECHWPYDVPVEDVRAAIAETGLPMVSLNARPGDRSAGEFGLAALPSRSAEARADIEEAIAYARAIDARAVHVMSGVGDGNAARAAFEETLDFACRAAPDLNILIEPINRIDVPGYFLGSVDLALEIRDSVGAENLRLMADCYHFAQMELDVPGTLERLFPTIGHVQIAGHPGRGAPDTGSLDYKKVFATLERLNWTGFVGAEYMPGGPTEAGLTWLIADA